MKISAHPYISRAGLITLMVIAVTCSEDPGAGARLPADSTTTAVDTATDDQAWKPPVTAWGDPDLQGMWPVGHMTSTPLIRPEEFGERALLTDEEYASRVKSLDARASAYENEIDSNKMGMGHWAEAGSPQRQASLIVDPPDGRLPELTEAGKLRAAELGSSWSRSAFDSVSDFDSWDRCITRGLPMSMFPFHYNNGIQVLQSPGYVVIRLEMIHETRIIPVNGRPPLDYRVRQWLGDSRGHWEGNTLVIVTTNFNGEGTATNSGTVGVPRPNYPASKSFRMTERLTRTSDESIDYTVTVEDPEYLTAPWTARLPWLKDPAYQFFEYACHEDNAAVRNFIETSRFERGIGVKKPDGA